MTEPRWKPWPYNRRMFYHTKRYKVNLDLASRCNFFQKPMHKDNINFDYNHQNGQQQRCSLKNDRGVIFKLISVILTSFSYLTHLDAIYCLLISTIASSLQRMKDFSSETFSTYYIISFYCPCIWGRSWNDHIFQHFIHVTEHTFPVHDKQKCAELTSCYQALL